MDLLEPSKWCAPMVIQAILSVMTIIIILVYSDLKLKRGMSRPLAAFLYLCISIIVLYIMLLLCQNKMEWASWVLLLLPIIISLF